MTIKAKTDVLHVDVNGKIHKVKAQTDEKGGVVDVKYADGRVETVRGLDVVNTQVAANLIAANRRSVLGKSKVELPQVLKDPK
jgi:hypothetical protein